MTFITRREVVTTTSQVEVPSGYEICPICDGLAFLSSYEMGARSFAHDPRLAVLRPCIGCGGVGYRLSSEAQSERSEQ